MTPNDLTLSWMLWLCVGFLIGYRYHVLKVRDAVNMRIKRQLQDRALDRMIADVAVRCIEHPTDARVN
ncbi:hypothetical protein LCGC14_0757700 [marine sediment metagenome]|uniref:Uncharacterized protein n=1 Tax=marine sediment metagenome TaxID=412755 RepID=A0A0F9Q250_9ZZZZ